MKPAVFLALVVAAAAAVAAQQDAPCSYIVRDRDSLFDISQRFGLTTAAVQDANPDLGPDALIKAGDVLALPCAGDATIGDSVLDLLARRDDTTVLFRAALAAGQDFVKTLNDTDFVGTVFAPNDTAFESLLEELNKTAAELLGDRPLLQSILAYHVVPEVTSLANKQNLTTLLDGEWIEVSRPKDVTRLVTTSGQKVRVTAEDLEAGKAVVDVVRAVLLPASAPLGDLPAPEDECVHTVQEGDTVFDIAKKYGTTVDSLKALNPELQDANFLRLGVKLVLFPSCV